MGEGYNIRTLINVQKRGILPHNVHGGPHLCGEETSPRAVLSIGAAL